MSWSVGGMLQQEVSTGNQLAEFLVEAGISDFVALLGAAIRALGLESRYALRAGLRYDGSEGPIIIRHPDSPGNYDEAESASIPIKRFLSARTSLDSMPDDLELLAAARDLALDCVSQAGITHLTQMFDVPAQ